MKKLLKTIWRAIMVVATIAMLPFYMIIDFIYKPIIKRRNKK